MDHLGPSSSSTESSHVSDMHVTSDDLDYDDDQSSSLESESEQSEILGQKKARFTRGYKYKSRFSMEWTKTWTFVAPVPHSSFNFRCTV